MNGLAASWMAVATVLVLFGPGWAWSLALFPRTRPLGAPRTRRTELDLVERAAVALVLSLVLVPLGALAWNGLLRIPLSTPFAVLYVIALTAAGWGVARRWPSVLGVRADHVRQQPDEDELDAEQEQHAAADERA
ncbi:MAG: hypothetical protein QOG31_1678 [Thermoplasmata archaeon]|jgi:uncharacterized membrane protein|nr:hypothetical protein [Thermoplasmata archaeon]HUR64112.1 DUF1616 domain-containing protein [Candidatus Thermoplasmatota archaeon]